MARKRKRHRITVQDKTCSRCGELKSAGEFYHDRKAATGLSSRCQVCIEVANGRLVAEPCWMVDPSCVGEIAPHSPEPRDPLRVAWLCEAHRRTISGLRLRVDYAKLHLLARAHGPRPAFRPARCNP